MKKILLLAVAVFISTFAIANDLSIKSEMSNPEIVQVMSDLSSEFMMPAPKFKFQLQIELGRGPDCIGWWPVCNFKIKFDDKSGSDEKSLPAVLEGYDDEVVLKISKSDLNSLDSREPGKNLINMKKVTFGQSCEFPDEVIKKSGAKSGFGLKASQSYVVTSDSKYVYVHVPFN